MREVTRRLLSEVRPNWLDRVVSYIAPRAGLARHKARVGLAMSGGYHGGRRDRRMTRSWRPREESADAALLPDLPDLRPRSRDLARNAPIATGAIGTMCTSVVGRGLQLKPEINRRALGLTREQAAELQEQIATEWAIFSRTADFTSVQHLDEMQGLVLRSELESGDLLVVRRYREDFGDVYGTKLQLIEADRISNPDNGGDGMEAPGREANRIFAGVEVNRDGRHMAYHVADEHPGALQPTKRQNTWRRIPARSSGGVPIALHLMNRTRPDLSRGAPFLAAVVEHLKKLADYSESELTAAEVASYFTVFVKSNLDDTDETGVLPGVTGSKSIAGDDGDELELGQGMVIDLAEGEDIAIADPKRPNESFDPFVQAMLRQIGVALGIPYELLIKHFTASYSASRAALEMAWQEFAMQRATFTRRFLQPVYEWFIEEAVASGRVAAPGFFEDPLVRAAYCQCSWIGPTRIQLDPAKEATADEKDVNNGFKTIEQVVMERTGGTFERKHEQRAYEVARRREDGVVQAPPALPSPSQDPPPEDTDEDDEGKEDAA